MFTQADFANVIREWNERLAERLHYRALVHEVLPAFDGKMINKRIKTALDARLPKLGEYASIGESSWNPYRLRVGTYNNHYDLDLKADPVGRLDWPATLAAEPEYWSNATPEPDTSAEAFAAYQRVEEALAAFWTVGGCASHVISYSKDESWQSIQQLRDKYQRSK